jgi:hypothetical protein
MDRRVALTFAGVGALTVAAGAAVVAANLGILGMAGADGEVGTLDAQTVSDLAGTVPPTTAGPGVVVVDEYVVEPGSSPASTTGAGVSGSPAGPTGDDRWEQGGASVDPAVTGAGGSAATVSPTTTSTTRVRVDDDRERHGEDDDREHEIERERDADDD